MKQTANTKRDERAFIVTNVMVESESGAMRFKDIWGKVERLPQFKSTRDLADTLRFLVNKKDYVRKCTISRKNVIYVLALDTKGLKTLRNLRDVNLNQMFAPKVFNEQYTAKVTAELKKEFDDRKDAYQEMLAMVERCPSIMTQPQVASFYEATWYQMLKGYLVILEHWVRAPECLDEHVRYLMINFVLERDYELLAKMGHTTPDGTDKCLQTLREKFDALTRDAFLKAGLKASE